MARKFFRLVPALAVSKSSIRFHPGLHLLKAREPSCCFVVKEKLPNQLQTIISSLLIALEWGAAPVPLDSRSYLGFFYLYEWHPMSKFQNTCFNGPFSFVDFSQNSLSLSVGPEKVFAALGYKIF